MGATAIDEILARRFLIDRPPTLVARRQPRAHVAFSRMCSNQPMRDLQVRCLPATRPKKAGQ